MTIGLAWLLVLSAADHTIPTGALAIHPMSEKAVEEIEGRQPKHVPDSGVELALVSYALPTRADTGPASLGEVGCSFTVSVENGKTSASVDEKGKEPCAMGVVTPSVVGTLGKWRFDPSAKSGRYWVALWVHFEEGSTTAEVDIPQTHLASAMPDKPYQGLHVVSGPSPRLRVKPKMPPEARAGGFDLTCKLRFWLDEQGTPTDVAVRECPPEFLDSVLEAGWQWRFDPYTVDGKAKSGEFTLDITFRS